MQDDLQQTPNRPNGTPPATDITTTPLTPAGDEEASFDRGLVKPGRPRNNSVGLVVSLGIGAGLGAFTGAIAGGMFGGAAGFLESLRWSPKDRVDAILLWGLIGAVIGVFTGAIGGGFGGCIGRVFR